MVNYASSICPGGHYCPNGTKFAKEFKCPRGTYSNVTGISNVNQCIPCPGKYYCDQEGQLWYTKLCSPGKLDPRFSFE